MNAPPLSLTRRVIEDLLKGWYRPPATPRARVAYDSLYAYYREDARPVRRSGAPLRTGANQC